MTKVKRLFVSIPMNGRPRKEIEADLAFYSLEAESLAGEDLDLIDSILPEKLFSKYNPLMCLSVSIEMLSNADYAYFGEGWKEARGCKIEHMCAEEYGVKILKD